MENAPSVSESNSSLFSYRIGNKYEAISSFIFVAKLLTILLALSLVILLIQILAILSAISLVSRKIFDRLLIMI